LSQRLKEVIAENIILEYSYKETQSIIKDYYKNIKKIVIKSTRKYLKDES